MPSHRISNAFSTGGGGFTFERGIGALYLASLISDYPAPTVRLGKVDMVQFQARSSGSLFDDIVVWVNDHGKQRRTCIFIRHKITPGENREFTDLMKDAWEMFTGNTPFNFDPNSDRFLLAVSSPAPAWLGDVKTVLQMAAASPNTKQFKTNVDSDGYLSKEKQKYLRAIKNALSSAKGSEITDEEAWKFLCCFDVQDFDVVIGGRDRDYCNSSLSRLFASGSNQDGTLFEVLSALVADNAPVAGAFTHDRLSNEVEKLGIIIKPLLEKGDSGGGPEKLLNEVVYKPLSTTQMLRASTYSVRLVDSEGKPIESLKYFKQAEKILATRPHIIEPLADAKKLVARFNSAASATARLLDECVVKNMKGLAPYLEPHDNFHTTRPNTYSLPSLRHLVWDYCEKTQDSEIMTTLPSRLSDFEANGNWILSQPISGPIITANNLIMSDPARHPTINEILCLLKSVGNESIKVRKFRELKSILNRLEGKVAEFRKRINDLSETIDLGLPEETASTKPKTRKKAGRKPRRTQEDSKQFDAQLEGLI